jgi:transcriptional regulator with XRE-family HTH domain
MREHPIRRFCRAHEWSQADVALEAGLSEGYVSQLVNGRERCGASAALRIAAATGIPVEELLAWNREHPAA